MDMEMNEKITLTKVKQMGFSDKLISLLLPEPELVDNPYYKSAAPMKLWNMNDVEEAMKKDAYINYQEKRQKRKTAAEKAVRIKKINLLNAIQEESDKIMIKIIPFDTLKSKAIQAKQEWYNQHYDPLSDEFRKSAYNADEDTINRWSVNYLRHRMTSYDEQLFKMARKTGNREAYMLLFELILNKIGKSYPELSDECTRQIEEKRCKYQLQSFDFGW